MINDVGHGICKTDVFGPSYTIQMKSNVLCLSVLNVNALVNLILSISFSDILRSRYAFRCLMFLILHGEHHDLVASDRDCSHHFAGINAIQTISDICCLYLALSAVLFTIGVAGVIIKRNVISMFMCIELMLNAVNITFVAFSSYFQDVQGQLFVFIVMTVAAAEAAVGLGIIIAIFRNRESLDVDDANILKL